MKEILLQEYNNLKFRLQKPLPQKNKFIVNFINGCKFEVVGHKKARYKVRFIDTDTEKCYFEDEITNNMWCKSNKQYFTNTKVIVEDLDSNEKVFKHIFNAKDKKVYIHLASKALGDTLAWFPYCEIFREKHECELIVSTFHNSFFEDKYPKIKFVEPATTVYDLYAMYEIGWHYHNNKVQLTKNPHDFKNHPLQKTATDILGLPYTELKPEVTFKDLGSTIEGDYICIAPHASAHAKYWNYPGGWQEVIDYFNDKGYKIVMITQEPLGDEWHDSKLGGTLKGVIDKTGDYPLKERANDLMNAKAYVGLGSGLSWVSWAVNTPTVLISGFSEPYSEFNDCERISTPKGNCTGCFNRTILDAGDWEWCPDHKDTDRHFECTKTITPKVVIDAINRQLKKSS